MRPIGKLWAAVASVSALTTALAIAPASTTVARADEWPSHHIAVVSPFAAGTTNDFVARAVLDPASSQLGQSFVIENRPGSGGTLGVAAVAKAAPDGYTLLLATSALTAAVVLHKALPYDIVRDFAPVAMFGGDPSMLMAAPQKGYTSVADLITAAKTTPGKIKFASVGIGSASHIAGLRFSQLAGIDVAHASYAGPTAALDDLAAGRIDFYFVPVTPALPLITQGKGVPLAVSTRNRLQSLPGLPTLAEAGYPLPVYLTWCGLAAPANTPAAIVSKLNNLVRNVLDLPGVRTKLLRSGYLPDPMTAEQFAQFVTDDLAAMVRLGKEAHIQPAE
jgi:tripartite-type tricarboxylate transporter receptor subunit TctC